MYIGKRPLEIADEFDGMFSTVARTQYSCRILLSV